MIAYENDAPVATVDFEYSDDYAGLLGKNAAW